MSEATITEPATANPATAAIPTGGGAPPLNSAPAGAPPLNGAPVDKSSAGIPSVNGAPVDKPPTGEPQLNGIPADKPSVGELAVDGAPVDKLSTGAPPVNGVPSSESAAPPEIYAVKMTAEEWKEQQDMMREYIPAITRDRKKAKELHRKIIFPSFILKADKLLMGADYIRKEGFNTVDADLVYGPGWLDEDDGGPISPFAEANKQEWGIE